MGNSHLSALIASEKGITRKPGPNSSREWLWAIRSTDSLHELDAAETVANAHVQRGQTGLATALSLASVVAALNAVLAAAFEAVVLLWITACVVVVMVLIEVASLITTSTEGARDLIPAIAHRRLELSQLIEVSSRPASVSERHCWCRRLITCLFFARAER